CIGGRGRRGSLGFLDDLLSMGDVRRGERQAADQTAVSEHQISPWWEPYPEARASRSDHGNISNRCAKTVPAVVVPVPRGRGGSVSRRTLVQFSLGSVGISRMPKNSDSFRVLTSLTTVSQRSFSSDQKTDSWVAGIVSHESHPNSFSSWPALHPE